MARNFALRPHLCDMAKHNPAFMDLAAVTSRNVEGACIVIARDPIPIPPRHHPQKPQPIRGIQTRKGGAIVETVTEADHPCGPGCLQLCLQSRKGFARFIGRQKASTAPGHPLGLPQMQVRDNQKLPLRPKKRARGAGLKPVPVKCKVV
jgi:hypothetical protein